MEIYLVRHGDAIANGEYHGDDEERPLTEKGKSQIRELAFLMSGQGIAMDRLFTSQARRAVETASLIREGCGWALPLELCTALGLASSSKILMDFLNTLPFNGQYLLVGHEPTLSNTIKALLGDNLPPSLVTVPKGNLFLLDVTKPVESGSAIIKWQLPITQGPAIA